MEAVVDQLANPLDRERLRTELPFDKFMKTVLIWLTLAVSALLIGSDYFGSNMNCKPRKDDSEEMMKYVNSFCWVNFHNVTNVTYSSSNVSGPVKVHTLPHKLFPFIYLSQAIAMLIPALLWEVSTVPQLLTFLKAVITFSNDLGSQLAEVYDNLGNTDADDYNPGSYMSQSFMLKAEFLSRDLHDLLVYWLDRRVTTMRNWYIAKHFLSALTCVLYIVLFFVLTPLPVLSESEILCEETHTIFHCTINNAYFEAVIWLFNMTVLCLSTIACICYAAYYFKEISVYDSFFFRNIPGLSTTEFVDSINGGNGITGLKLLSTFLYHNESYFATFAYLKRNARRVKDKPVSALSSSIKRQWTTMKLRNSGREVERDDIVARFRSDKAPPSPFDDRQLFPLTVQEDNVSQDTDTASQYTDTSPGRGFTPPPPDADPIERTLMPPTGRTNGALRDPLRNSKDSRSPPPPPIRLTDTFKFRGNQGGGLIIDSRRPPIVEEYSPPISPEDVRRFYMDSRAPPRPVGGIVQPTGS